MTDRDRAVDHLVRRERAVNRLVRRILRRWIVFLPCMGLAAAVVYWLLPAPGTDTAADVLATIAGYLFVITLGFFVLTMLVIAIALSLPLRRNHRHRRGTHQSDADT